MSDTEESPLSSVPVPSALRQPIMQQSSPSFTQPKKGEMCCLCKATDVPLLRCKACSTVKYCGSACQKLDWKQHKSSCTRMRELRDGRTITRHSATLNLVNRVTTCMVELWLQLLASKILELGAHPERAQTHALVLSWAVIPTVSPREYRKGHAPRERLNTSGQQQYMLTLQNWAIRGLEGLGGPEGPEGRDWKTAMLQSRPHETVNMTLDEGEAEPIRVVVFNMVDPNFGRGSGNTMTVRRMTVRADVHHLLLKTEEEELPQKGLPGEDVETYIARSLNESVMKDVHNEWKLRTYLPAQENSA